MGHIAIRDIQFLNAIPKTFKETIATRGMLSSAKAMGLKWGSAPFTATAVGAKDEQAPKNVYHPRTSPD